MSTNKQRIPMLSQRDIEAHEATRGWWGPGVCPRDATLAVLKAYRVTGDAAQAIIDDAIDPLGRYRMDENFRKKRLSRAEMIEQAKGTAEVARELYGRLLNMDTYIRAWAEEDSYRVWNDLGFLDSGQQYLLRLEALMKAASAKARRLPSKVPSRTGHRNRLLAETVESVGNRCAGKTKADVREIAAALLTCWGVDSPTDASKARKAIKRAK